MLVTILQIGDVWIGFGDNFTLTRNNKNILIEDIKNIYKDINLKFKIVPHENTAILAA